MFVSYNKLLLLFLKYLFNTIVFDQKSIYLKKKNKIKSQWMKNVQMKFYFRNEVRYQKICKAKNK